MTRARARYELTAEDRTGRAFRSFKRSLSDSTRRLRALGGAGGIAGLLGGAGAIAGLRSVANTMDRIGKLSKQLNASTTFLSEMRHVAELAGVSFESFTRAMRVFQVNTTNAQRGNKLQAEAFEALRLDAEKLGKLRPERQFNEIAAALLKIKTSTKQQGIAAALFGGRGGGEMLQLMRQGLPAIASQRAEARTIGRSFTASAVKGMEDFNDSTTRLKGTFEGLGATVATELAPALRGLADSLRTTIIPTLQAARASTKVTGTAIGGGAAVLGSVAKQSLLSGSLIGGLVRASLDADTRFIFSETVSDVRDYFKNGIGARILQPSPATGSAPAAPVTPGLSDRTISGAITRGGAKVTVSDPELAKRLDALINQGKRRAGAVAG